MEDKTFTTFYIAKLLDVYPTTVAKWIDEGRVKAFVTPGGHRRVRYADLLDFLKKYELPIPFELRSSDRKKILIIDDDEMVLESIEKIIATKAEKYDTYTARDGFQAGTAMSEFKPDIVILDIKLPGIDGFEVCRTIKKQKGSVKIIAVTGYPDEESRKKILASGADAYLPKPFEADELLIKIAEVEK